MLEPSMTNPGPYLALSSEVTWPFVALLGAILAVPLTSIAVLMLIAGRSMRPRAIVAAGLALIVGGVSGAGLLKADSEFAAEQSRHHNVYIENVQSWMKTSYRLTAMTEEVEKLLEPAGPFLRVDGSSGQIGIRTDATGRRLVVVDEALVELPAEND
ncbi:hypothetical protein ABIE21_000504 [Conyzicola nivalis]|uniref:Uncharacterized protein n=1 Tax=Conyzicola nivalis TaxID=1477021 RepID=A0ABV2QIY5_9MICO